MTNKIVSIPETEWAVALPLFEFLEVKKGDHLFKQGQVCRYITFIVEGCLRFYLNHDDKEITRQVFFENAFLTELGSFPNQKPSAYNLDALENSKLLQISYQNMNLLYDYSPNFLRLGKVVAEQTASWLVQRNVQMVTQSAQERYEALIKERPKMIQRVPLHIIASYLGITPQALSRLRSKRPV